jgi:hypothetical protein
VVIDLLSCPTMSDFHTFHWHTFFHDSVFSKPVHLQINCCTFDALSCLSPHDTDLLFCTGCCFICKTSTYHSEKCTMKSPSVWFCQCKGTSVHFLTSPILSHSPPVHMYSPSSPLYYLQGPYLRPTTSKPDCLTTSKPDCPMTSKPDCPTTSKPDCPTTFQKSTHQ